MKSVFILTVTDSVVFVYNIKILKLFMIMNVIDKNTKLIINLVIYFGHTASMIVVSYLAYINVRNVAISHITVSANVL